MADRFDFPTLSKVGNVDVPVNNTDTANKQYVDNKVAANGFNFDGSFSDILIGAGFVQNASPLTGPTTSIILFSDDATALAAYLNTQTNVAYRFAGSSITFKIASAVVAFNDVNATITTTDFMPAIPGNQNLQIATQFLIQEVTVASPITGTVTANSGGNNILTLGSAGGGGGSLQALSDVMIVEPVFARIGTLTVDTVDPPNNQIIITQINTGINVGDYLNGTGAAGSATLEVIFVTTIGANTNVQFSANPATYFNVGSSIFRLGTGINGFNLQWNNTTNRWIAVRPSFALPFDITDWTNNDQKLYITDVSVPIQTATITSNVAMLTSPWTFAVATLPGFTSGKEVIGQDISGKSVSGRYLSAADAGGSFAVLQDVLPDRLAGGGFALNTSYSLYWRQGIDALQTSVQFSGTNITQGAPAVIATADTEIANKIGYVVQATGLLDSIGTTTATAVIISGTQMSVFDASNNASALVTALTGQANPVQGQFYFPLTSAARVGLGNAGGTQSLPVASYGYTGVAQASVTVNFASGVTNAQIVAIFNGAASNNIYVGPTSWGQFLFQTPPLAAIDREIAANSVNSLDGIQGPVSLVAGTGIGISDNIGSRTIQITNTGSGTSGAGNTVDFTNNQFSEAGITELATESIYIEMGYTTSLEAGSGGTLNGITYWDTTNAAASGAGNGIRARVATTWTSLNLVIYTPSYSVIFTTPAGASASNYLLDNLLFAKKSYTGNITANANLWPPLRDSGGGSDDIQLIPVVQPTFSVVSSGTNQWTASIGQGIWRVSFGNYAWLAADLTTEYVAYLRIRENSGVQQPPTFVSLTRTSGLGGIQLLTSLPGTSGSTPTLQQVINVGNQLSNASPNVAAITLLDTTSTPNRTYSLSATGGADIPKLVLEGSTSGNITQQAAATTNSYTLDWPATFGASGQTMMTAGLNPSVTAWDWSAQQIAAIATANVPITGAQTADGYVLQNNERVLLTAQTTASERGLYLVNTTGAWVRITTYTHQSCFALNGTLNIGRTYQKSAPTVLNPNENWILVAVNSGGGGTANPPIWLTGSGAPADSLGVVGNYYQDTSVTPNFIWLKTQTATSPFWVRQPNAEAAIKSFTVGSLTFGFATVVALSNITLSGSPATIDGVSVAAGSIVLAAAQTTSADDGLYVVSAGTWVRQTVTPTSPAVSQGLVVIVSAGNTQAGNSFIQTSPITTVGTSNQTWSTFAVNGAPTFTATMLASPVLANRTIPANSTPIVWNSDGTYPVNQTISGGNYAIRQNNQGFSIAGATNVFRIGFGTNFSTFDQSSNLTTTSVSCVGVSNVGNVSLTSETAGLAKLTFPIEMQLVGQKVTIGGGLANQFQINGGAAGSPVSLGVLGSDTDISILLLTKGAGTVTIGNTSNCALRVTGHQAGALILSPTSSNPACGLTLQGLGTGTVSVGANFANYLSIQGGGSGSAVLLTATGSDATINLGLNSKGTTGSIVIDSSRANYLQLTSATTGNAAVISAQGSDTNRGITISTGGVAPVLLGNTASSAGLSVVPNATSTQTQCMAVGLAANLDLVLQSKGTGATILGNTGTQTGFTVAGGNSTYAALNATGPAALIDFVLTPKGSGSLYPIGGTLSATLSNQPRIFLATQLGSTTLGPGAGLQAIRSNGNGAAPFWSAVGGTWYGRLAAGTSIGASDTTINATVVSNSLPSYVSFANGVLTNNSSFTITVSISYSLALTNSATAAPPETDMWVRDSGGVRYAQIAWGANDWLGSAGAWSSLRSLNVNVPLAANASVSCLAFSNGAVASLTGAIFGGFTTATIFTIL